MLSGAARKNVQLAPVRQPFTPPGLYLALFRSRLHVVATLFWFSFEHSEL